MSAAAPEQAPNYPWAYDSEQERRWEQEKRGCLVRYGAAHAEVFAPILTRWEAAGKPIAKGLRAMLRVAWKQAQGAA